ncbi:MAG: ABC transporter ATP-binding protein/permease [Negativicutes bacterium]|nr:ABC transporter ATP-binding protein/permease [Negativicutes bacterium]
MKYLYLLKPFFRVHWPVYAAGVLVLICVDLLYLIIPRLIGKTVDSIIQNAYFMHYLWQMLGVAGLIAVLRYVYRECIMGTTRRLEFYLREKLFLHAQRISLSFFDKQGPGKIMALTTNDITAVRMAVGLGIMLLVDAVIMGAASMVIMVRVISWDLALWAISPLFPTLLIATLMGRLVHDRFRNVQEKFSALTEFVQEAFAGVKVIKGFAAESIWTERFQAISGANVEASLAMARLQAAYIPVTHTLPLFSYAITLFIGGNLIIRGAITVGDFAAFIGYLGLILWPVMGIGYLINTIQRGTASLTRLGDFMSIPIYEDEKAAEQCMLNGYIQISGLTFAYPGSETPSLNGIDLDVPAGVRVGIVGRPGAGKSTLLKLLLRLYDPPAGSIFIDGREIHKISFAALRRSTGYVPQDGMLFSQTIGENIAFDGDYSRDEVIRAAQIAAVNEDIDTKAEGYSRTLNEKGKNLSGGQQQRVAIARAIIKKPSILLLDDVFSALDYRTQSQVLANMNEFLAGRTSIIVSQRIAAVKEADLIIVLDRGRVVERGTHAELVTKRGLYYKLYEQQFADGEA